MPLPDRNDPIRPLALATRSMRVLGILSIGIGLYVVVAYGYLNTLVHFRPYFLAGDQAPKPVLPIARDVNVDVAKTPTT